ncbi:MAG: ACT domain-containing protein [Chloroflexi bacterium]|nr:ACT domain-containing protein [Chloroflexota bacterium]
MARSLRFAVLPERLAIARLEPDSDLPEWAASTVFCAVTRTSEELSVVCPESEVPTDVECDRGWRALKIEGPLELDEVGIVRSLAVPLAEVGVSIFVISTYETDYVLVREVQLETALSALAEHGHTVRE